MRQPGHLIVPFHKHGGNRERRSFQASEAVFDVVLTPIFAHGVLQRQASLRRITGIGAPAQCRNELCSCLLAARYRRDLIAHALAHLLWALGPTSSASYKRDLLLDLPFIGVREQ